MITGPAIRAARGYLGWSQAELAKHASVSPCTIAKIESEHWNANAHTRTIKKLTTALEAAGVKLFETA